MAAAVLLMAGQNSNYVIEVKLNPDVFKEDLKQFNIYPDSGSFLIDLTNSNEIAMASTGRSLQPHDILIDFAISGKSGTDLGKIDDYRYYSVYARSDYLSLLLLRYLPENLVFTPMQNFTSWNRIGSQLKMSYRLTHFVGYRFALFSYATKVTGGSAYFDCFEVS